MDEDSLDYLYTMYFAALNAVQRYTWITAYPPPLPSEEPEEVRQARELVNIYDQNIRRRFQEIQDRVTRPVQW